VIAGFLILITRYTLSKMLAESYITVRYIFELL
jgi:hypothetical protein